MVIFHNFIYAITLFIIISIGVYAYIYRRKPGAKPLIVLMVFSLLWNLTSYLELMEPSLDGKIFWRDIQQLSSFLIPFTMFVFVQSFLENKKMLKFSKVLIVVPIFFIALILTNSYHGLVRSGYALIEVNENYTFLSVQQTVLGVFNVFLNLSLLFFAVVSLFIHYRKAIGEIKNQIKISIIGLLTISFLLVLNMTVLRNLEIYIMTSAFYMPGIFMMFYAVFKYQFFNISLLSKDRLLEAIDQIIIILNKDGIIIEFNQKATEFLNHLSPIEIEEGMAFYNVFSHTLFVDNQTIKSKKDLQRIKVDLNGTEKYYAINYHPLENQGVYEGMMLIFEDVTISQLYEKTLKEKADQDSLTNLYNRSAFEKRYNDEIALNKGMIMLDIDDFKHVNDTYGHHVGDLVLKKIANAMQSVFKHNVLCGRLGGEEFAVGIFDTNQEEMLFIAERIRKTIEKNKVAFEGTKISVTVSVGVSFDDQAIKPFDDVRHEADKALYQAKASHKNCVKFYNH